MQHKYIMAAKSEYPVMVENQLIIMDIKVYQFSTQYKHGPFIIKIGLENAKSTSSCDTSEAIVFGSSFHLFHPHVSHICKSEFIFNGDSDC